MKLRHAVAITLWALVLLGAWASNPWGPPGSKTDPDSEIHDINFHMHAPLHKGGKVSMAGQFHLELLSRPNGRHSLWLSNAFRQELDPAGFSGDVVIDRGDGRTERALFRRVGRTFELEAITAPVADQAWLTVNGQLGTIAKFGAVRYFWDFRRPQDVPLGLDRMVPVPRGNPLTKVRISLGRDLFFDPGLSRDGNVSCASCHKPEFAFADDQPLSLGIKGRQGQRNTPTVLNAAYHRQLFWDGRVNSLEDQAKQPIFNHAEMGIDNETMLIDRLKNKYHERFRQVFGQPISLQTVAKALACYERTLLSGDSDFDRYEGGNRDALLPSAVRGRALFFGKAGCGHCHIPPLFTDYKFHNLGIGWDGAKFADAGRYKVTEFKKDRGTFKTPSLRDVTRTGPYMHDGSIPTLRKVIEFYNMGGHTNPTLDSQMKTLSLTEKHIDDIVAFLHSLEGRYKVEIRPALSPPAPKKAP